MSTCRHLRAGAAADGPWQVSVTPEQAGWAYCGLRVLALAPGGSHAFGTGADEAVLLPLAGSCEVGCDGEVFGLAGRDGVFAGPTDFAYLPRDSQVRVSSRAAGGSRWPAPGPASAWPRGTGPPAGSPSNCAAPGPAPGGCTTSACPACSRRTG